MKISIIIPLYNKEKYIDRCVQSLLNQDISPEVYEIILVDDGSADSSGLIARKYADDHENIQCICQENAGPSAARNRGLEVARGDYLYFLDADDYLAYDVFDQLLEICWRHNLEILEFNTREIREGQVEDQFKTSTRDTYELDFPVTDGVTYVAENGFENEAWRYFVKNELLKSTGIKFVEGTLFEDAIFTASLFLQAKRISRANLDIHRYVTVENSIVTSKSRGHNMKFINGMMNAVEKFHFLTEGLDKSHEKYPKAVKKLRTRQQGFVCALLIRTLRYGLLNKEDLSKVLIRMKNLQVYPFDPSLGGKGIGNSLCRKLLMPVFNNQRVLYFGIGIMRLVPNR